MEEIRELLSGFYRVESLEYLSNAVIPENQDVVLEYVSYQTDEELKAEVNIKVDQGARLEFVLIDLNEGNSDIEIKTDIADNSNLTIKLGCLCSNSSQKKFDFNVEQKGKKSKSLVSMLGVAQGKSDLVFTGVTKIVKGAIKSEARQESRIADLSPQAKTTASPILLIDENDIVASHGAALGKIEENQLFYLMSRGLTKEEAETIITLGYLKPIIALVKSDEVKASLNEYIESKVMASD